MISGTQTEKMDHFELLKITEGKNRKRSLVFCIVDHKNEKNYELLVDHGHIAFCSDHGPKPNSKAKLTKNGPTRVYQRIFRQKFKDEVYRHPKKDLLTSYNETKSIFLNEMNIDPELDNFVEYQDISTDTERYIFDYLFISIFLIFKL